MSTYEGQARSEMQFDEGPATKPPVIQTEPDKAEEDAKNMADSWNESQFLDFSQAMNHGDDGENIQVQKKSMTPRLSRSQTGRVVYTNSANNLEDDFSSCMDDSIMNDDLERSINQIQDIMDMRDSRQEIQDVIN